MLLLGAVGLWLVTRYGGPLPGERRVAHWQFTHGPLPKWLHDADQLFSALGEPVPAILLAAALALVAGELAGPRAARFVLAAATVVVLTTLMKAAFDPTPLDHDETRRYGLPLDGSYPSGHTAFATALFGACAILAAGRGLRVVPGVCIVIALAMGVSRITSGAHDVSDVLGGWAIGAAWLCALLAIRRRSQP